MYFTIRVEGRELLLPAKEFQKFFELVDTSLTLREDWVGKGKGNHGDDLSYMRSVSDARASEWFKPGVISDGEVQVYVLAAKTKQT